MSRGRTAPEPAMIERPDGIRHPSATYARAFLGLVRAGEVLQHELDADLKAGHGISLREFEVLLHLAAFSPAGTLRMTRLTEQAPLSQSRVSRLVGQLEARGLVARAPVEGDSRGVDVSITKAGLRLLKAAQETHYGGLARRLFAKLDWADIRHLARLTDRILEPDTPPVPRPGDR